jgi:hypothetical protein
MLRQEKKHRSPRRSIAPHPPTRIVFLYETGTVRAYCCGERVSGRNSEDAAHNARRRAQNFEVFMLKAAGTLFLFLATAQPRAQTGPPGNAAAAAPPALHISLERKLPDGKVEAMASDHVFDTGDVVHFRVESEYDGYLYVMDQGTSGRFTTVFPTAEAGADNRVHRGQTFSIPSQEESWYQISGPAGFDVLYFLLSPDALAPPVASSFAAPGPVSSLKPRCNDAVFRARGECTDINAGPAPLPKGEPLPAPLAPMAGMASRDITIVQKKDGVTVGSKGNTRGPVIYTFRMAHQ